MQDNENGNTNVAQSALYQDEIQSQFQLSAKLRDKLEKLAQWRIDPSLIEFPGDTREFSGGFAKVTGAFLVSSRDNKGCVDGSGHSSKDGEKDGSPSRKSDGDTQKSEDHDRGNPEHRDSLLDHPEKYEKGKGHEGKDEQQKPVDQTAKPKAVAVKKLKFEKDSEPERVLGLALRECEFLLELSHPNIVKLEGFVEDTSKHMIWLIFIWEENGNLRDFLTSGEWAIPERISLINDVARGVEYLHNQDPPVYHGDLKSLNILVNSDYHAMITDFGSARHLENQDLGRQTQGNEDKPQQATGPGSAGEENTSIQVTFDTSTNTITLSCDKYTLRWAAPELLRDENPCLGSDIWALGWIAYEVITNSIPFHDTKLDTTVVQRVIKGDLPSLTNDARMSMIQALCSLMVKCWSPDPNKRPMAEDCRKLIAWIPMLIPAPADKLALEASQARSARLLHQLGSMYMQQGDFLNALSCYTKALNIYTSIKNDLARADTLLNIGNVHEHRTEFNEAAKSYDEALRISTDLGYQPGRARALLGLGSIHRRRNEYSEAVTLYSDALEIYTNTGNQSWRAETLWSIADVHRLQNRLSEAIPFYSEAIQIHTGIGDMRGRAKALLGLGSVHLRRSEFTEVVVLFSEALQIFIDTGDQVGRADALLGLADVRRAQGEYNKAKEFYSEALEGYTNTNVPIGTATALWALAETHRLQNEFSDAAACYSKSLKIFTDTGNRLWRANSMFGLAEVHHKLDHHLDAISIYTEASEIFGEIGESEGAALALTRASDIRRGLEGAHDGMTEA